MTRHVKLEKRKNSANDTKQKDNTMDYAKITELQLTQLRRLLELRTVDFRTAYYVIFSDYPTKRSLARIIGDSAIKIDDQLLNRLCDEMSEVSA